jgi:GNAT superfamily N-acetyltransferase
VLLAEDIEGIAGFACAYLHEDAHWGTLLDNLHTTPTRKGQGIGTQLIGRIAGWALAQGSASLYLWVFEANVDARRFYAHLGANSPETVVKSNPDGSEASVCRCVWHDLPALATRG